MGPGAKEGLARYAVGQPMVEAGWAGRGASLSCLRRPSPAATLRDPSNQLGYLVFILTGFHLSRVGRGACRIVQWKLSLSCLEQVQTINI